MVYNIFIHKTFMNILHLNLCGKYMPMAVWIRVKKFTKRSILQKVDDLSTELGLKASIHKYPEGCRSRLQDPQGRDGVPKSSL